MIWLDSAATSYHKPASVRRAVWSALTAPASPGRGGYPAAMAAADLLFRCRCALGEMFGVSDPERVVFTSSATHGLNIAIKSLVKPGDPVVISGYEHNAVLRPLHALGAEIRVASSPLFDRGAAAEAFARALPGAKAAVCTQVSNVFGFVLPVEEIALLCRDAGVPLIVDAAQGAGVLPLDFDGDGYAFAAMPGHKGLLGPQGTGVLLCGKEARALPLMEGGTGSDSESAAMPAYLPDRLEAGTHNVPGIAGLLAGIQWLAREGVSNAAARERALCRQIAAGLRKTAGIRLYEAAEPEAQTGVLSLELEAVDCEEAAQALARRDIALRAGLHCAPLAHRTAGTLARGTLRLSVSPFTTEAEAETAVQALREVARGGGTEN